jgi:hypothetical protein
VTQLSTFRRRSGGRLPLTGGDRRLLFRRPREGPFSTRLPRRAIIVSDHETPHERGWRLRADSPEEERTLWKEFGAKRFGGFKSRSWNFCIWSVLCALTARASETSSPARGCR